MAREVTMLGKTWTLIYPNRIGDDGDRGKCDCHERKKYPKIRILRSLRGEERLEVYIHELMHAGGWFLDEEYIREVAQNLARELTLLGYVNTEEKHG